MNAKRAVIDGFEVTLNYDQDQLDRRFLTSMSDPGKVEWFRLRMGMVFLAPMARIFDTGSVAHRELMTNPDEMEPFRNVMIAAFSVVMNGVEACGSFLRPVANQRRPGEKYKNFRRFISSYMPEWDADIEGLDPPSLVRHLWEHFRNGIAHGFVIDHGGIRIGFGNRWEVRGDYVHIEPVMFFRDFQKGLEAMFTDVGDVTSEAHGLFLDRFKDVYKH